MKKSHLFFSSDLITQQQFTDMIQTTAGPSCSHVQFSSTSFVWGGQLSVRKYEAYSAIYMSCLWEMPQFTTTQAICWLWFPISNNFHLPYGASQCISSIIAIILKSQIGKSLQPSISISVIVIQESSPISEHIWSAWRFDPWRTSDHNTFLIFISAFRRYLIFNLSKATYK